MRMYNNIKAVLAVTINITSPHLSVVFTLHNVFILYVCARVGVGVCVCVREGNGGLMIVSVILHRSFLYISSGNKKNPKKP